MLRVWIDTVNERPAIVGVELWGIEPQEFMWPEPFDKPLTEAPVRAADVRLPLGEFLDSYVKMHLGFATAGRKLWGERPGVEEKIQRFEAKFKTEPHGGRQRLTDEFLTMVAEVYLKAVRSGDRKPAVAVRKALEAVGRPTSESNARTWIHQARKRLPELFTEEDEK